MYSLGKSAKEEDTMIQRKGAEMRGTLSYRGKTVAGARRSGD